MNYWQFSQVKYSRFETTTGKQALGLSQKQRCLSVTLWTVPSLFSAETQPLYRWNKLLCCYCIPPRNRMSSIRLFPLYFSFQSRICCCSASEKNRKACTLNILPVDHLHWQRFNPTWIFVWPEDLCRFKTLWIKVVNWEHIQRAGLSVLFIFTKMCLWPQTLQ